LKKINRVRGLIKSNKRSIKGGKENGKFRAETEGLPERFGESGLTMQDLGEESSFNLKMIL